MTTQNSRHYFPNMTKIRDFSICSSVILLLAGVCRADQGPGIPGKVEGVVGYPIALPCDITPVDAGDSPHLMLWYKNIFGTPIYSVDARWELGYIQNSKSRPVTYLNCESSYF